MAAIFSTTNMSQSASTLFSAYASYAASMMMVRSMANEIIPHEFRSYISSVFHYFFTPLSPTLTLIIQEFTGMIRNQVFGAVSTYLRTKISPSTERLRISKTPREGQISVTIDKGESLTDVFDGVKLRWKYVCVEPRKDNYSKGKKYFELSFDKKFKDKVMGLYLPYILEKAKELKEEKKVLKLYSKDCPRNDGDGDGGGMWGSINLEHPATFETVAMDPELKKLIMEDLERFVRRRDFYKRVGKAWKRGYLLYGPPGTGKSSLIAAMANYLKFDIYDLDLTSIYSNSDLQRILLSTTNRSILVIEDIDCSVEMHNRHQDPFDGYVQRNSKLTLSGLLNFIDGLWSSCGDERIIIFTTNYKDKLDPALLRPGRMDMLINMSYCNTPSFHILASNYLGIQSKTHRLSNDIEGLIETTNVTPAEVAEELMKSEDSDVALEGILKFLKRKNSEANEVKNEENCKVEEHENKRQKTDDDEKKICTTGRRKNLGASGRGRKKKKFV